jgi:hypothetical protein
VHHNPLTKILVQVIRHDFLKVGRLRAKPFECGFDVFPRVFSIPDEVIEERGHGQPVKVLLFDLREPPGMALHLPNHRLELGRRRDLVVAIPREAPQK